MVRGVAVAKPERRVAPSDRVNPTQVASEASLKRVEVSAGGSRQGSHLEE